MNEEGARRLAASAGLARIDDKHLAQLVQGIESTRLLVERLPKDLHWTEESAHIFRLLPKSERRP